MLVYLCLLLIVLLTLYLVNVYSRFSKYGVKHFRCVPLLGTMSPVVFRKEHLSEHIKRIYQSFPGERFKYLGHIVTEELKDDLDVERERRALAVRSNMLARRFVGSYQFTRPLLIIRDLELAKRITIQHYDHFHDHGTVINEKIEPLFGRNLLFLKGDEWRAMRAALNPAFTSAKIRLMVPFMGDVGVQLVKALQEELQHSKEGFSDIDIRDPIIRFANDVIASCAFGLKVESQYDRRNQFFLTSKEASDFNIKQFIIFFAYLSFYEVASALKLALFTESTREFFTKLVLHTMKEREDNNILRHDLINILIDIKKGNFISSHNVNDEDEDFETTEISTNENENIKPEWSDDDLIAQAVLFLLAGLETTSSSMSFLLHKLAIYPQVQERLLLEIREQIEKSGGKLNYDAMQQMQYLDMVTSELLRMISPNSTMDRVCTKDYNLGKPNDQAKEDFIIRKGEGVAIPLWAYHYDPQYFPDPEVFNPERFSKENRQKIKPYTYTPFGVGHRICVGKNFAVAMMKVMTCQMLQAFEISPAPRTRIPARLDPGYISPCIQGGHWVRLRNRE